MSTVIIEESFWSVFPTDRHYTFFPYIKYLVLFIRWRHLFYFIIRVKLEGLYITEIYVPTSDNFCYQLHQTFYTAGIKYIMNELAWSTGNVMNAETGISLGRSEPCWPTMELFRFESFMEFIYVRRVKFPKGLIFTTPKPLLLFFIPSSPVYIWSSSKTSSIGLNCIDRFTSRNLYISITWRNVICDKSIVCFYCNTLTPLNKLRDIQLLLWNGTSLCNKFVEVSIGPVTSVHVAVMWNR